MPTTKLSNSPNQPSQQTALPVAHRKTEGNNRGLTQAYVLRDLTCERAMALKDEPYDEGETKASRAQAICALVRAWEGATSQIRILRGKPLPGSLRPIAKPKKQKVISSAPSEEPSTPGGS